MRLRQAIDEVIDTPRTGRFVLAQTEKTEKTYVGTKVEILIRDYLGFPKGILDLVIDGIDVDVKNTIGTSWMIPTEAVGKACILVQENEQTAKCSIGVVVCRPEYLTGGTNKDGKTSLSAAGKANIHWLLRDHPYPKNFWETVQDSVRRYIVEPRGGTQRLYRLFTTFPEMAISRKQAEAIARQKDFMKRLRGNGGVRDVLGPEGIALLNGTFDINELRAYGMTNVAADEFVAVPIKTEAQMRVLKNTGRHPYVTRYAD